MRKTLAQAKNAAAGIAQSVGIPACDPRFLGLLNRAQEELADMGKWWGTYQRLRICITANCITWPRGVKAIEGINQCGLSMPVRNAWYEFQENVKAPSLIDCECVQAMLLDRSTTPQFRDITASSYIRIYSGSASDDGKRVLLQGLDQNGIPIRTLDGSEWVDGEYVELLYPFVTSTNAFLAPGLTGVQKPFTNQRLTVFGVAVNGGTATQIAIWDPSEENPAYRRSYLTSRARQCGSVTEGSWCQDNGDGCTEPIDNCTGNVIEVIARLEFIPAIVDSDWLFIGNLKAILHQMKCIQKEDKNQYDLAENERQRAIRVLRNELEAYSPPGQMVVNVETMGTAQTCRIFGGFL